MPFGLKNAGPTYQRAIQKCLASQCGRNVEAYVDDVVVKSKQSDDLIADLKETFDNMRAFQWKLNPKSVCLASHPKSSLDLSSAIAGSRPTLRRSEQ
jgi:hypothetical protein